MLRWWVTRDVWVRVRRHHLLSWKDLSCRPVHWQLFVLREHLLRKECLLSSIVQSLPTNMTACHDIHHHGLSVVPSHAVWARKFDCTDPFKNRVASFGYHYYPGSRRKCTWRVKVFQKSVRTVESTVWIWLMVPLESWVSTNESSMERGLPLLQQRDYKGYRVK